MRCGATLLPCLPVLGPLLAILLVAEPPGARMPRWPTEIDVVAEPLVGTVGKRGDERRRVEALAALDRFPTAAIAHVLPRAVADPATEVAREALRICFERGIAACVPAAAGAWARADDRGLRLAALRVLAWHADESGTALLLEALRDPAEEIRAATASFLGWSRVPEGLRPRVREALVAKLTDVATGVRREAALALGLWGPGPGAVALANLLEDPDPAVRAAAAEALGGLEEAALVPALRRALQPPDTKVTRSILDALARIPGPAAEIALLELLDSPPEGTAIERVGLALGRRHAPSATLLDGLVARLAEPDLQDVALEALSRLGAPGRTALAQARAHGLPAALELRVADVLATGERAPKAALSVATEPAQAWRLRLRSQDLAARLEAARTLAELAPPWLMDHIAAEIERPSTPHPRPALLLLAFLGPAQMRLGERPLVRAHLAAVARDRSAPPLERCLSLSALDRGLAGPGSGLDELLSQLRADANPEIRGCALSAAPGLSRSAERALLEGLWDPSPRARAAAALATMRLETRRSELEGRLMILAATETDPEARTAALVALKTPRDGRTPPAPAWLVHDRPEPFGHLETTAGVLVIPTLPTAGHEIAFVPWAPPPIEGRLAPPR